MAVIENPEPQVLRFAKNKDAVPLIVISGTWVSQVSTTRDADNNSALNVTSPMAACRFREAS